MRPLDYIRMHNPRMAAMEDYVRDMSWRDLEIDISDKGRRARRMISSVRSEIRHMKGLVRLRPLGNAILYGYIKPHHNIMGHIAGYFAMRFPYTVIILGNSVSSHVAYYGKTLNDFAVSAPLREVINEMESIAGEKDDIADEIWKAYYSCYQEIETRQWRRMPSVHLKSAGIGTPGVFPRIDDYDENNED